MSQAVVKMIQLFIRMRLLETTKPFDIPKILVWKAYKLVKANKGVGGIDSQSIDEFEENLKGNLYKIWNRMSSGCYFPPAVKAVPIPKKSGGKVCKMWIRNASNQDEDCIL